MVTKTEWPTVFATPHRVASNYEGGDDRPEELDKLLANFQQEVVGLFAGFLHDGGVVA